MEDSKNDKPLDIKESSWAHAGVMTGRLLDGKYATARSAGNYLAGLNGVTGTFQGQHISGTTYMKLAGAYEQQRLTSRNAARILTFGTSFGPAPYYGEIPYSGRMILKGIHSLSRVGNPLNATEAQQIISNAKNLGLPIESNLKGLQGLEITGQWGGIPHFKVGNVHIPIEKGLDKVLKF